MMILLGKSQARKAILDYPDEYLETEEFHSLLKALLRNYSQWHGADMAGLFKPYRKQVDDCE